MEQGWDDHLLLDWEGSDEVTELLRDLLGKQRPIGNGMVMRVASSNQDSSQLSSQSDSLPKAKMSAGTASDQTSSEASSDSLASLTEAVNHVLQARLARQEVGD